MRKASFEEIRGQHQDSGTKYFEFLREQSMSCGLYVLAPGDIDTQEPHSEDEIYVILSGKGRFEHNGVRVEVCEGDFLYVPAHDKHRFLDITEELSILVIFAPAEYSLAT